jgi:predicted transposase/invertase (TIGR01784 family)
MFDNICKFLAENFSQDFATWLIGEPITFTELSPSELSNEPIRADALILRQSSRWILHLEFQTNPDEEIPFRMADYRIRGYRRFPEKRMLQYVIYLKKTSSELVYKNTFLIDNLRHEFNVIRLWEQPLEIFLRAPGLLPFAVLSSTTNREGALIEVAKQIDEIADKQTKSNLTASTSVLAGLVLEKDFIQRVLRTEVMQESVIYQEIIQQGLIKGRAEGRAEGIEEASRLFAINLIINGMSLEDIVKFTGLSVERVQQLQQEVSNG